VEEVDINVYISHRRHLERFLKKSMQQKNCVQNLHNSCDAG